MSIYSSKSKKKDNGGSLSFKDGWWSQQYVPKPSNYTVNMNPENKITLERIKREHGNDWTEMNFFNMPIISRHFDFTGITLPKDRSTLKQISNGTFFGCTFSNIDIGEYNIDGICFSWCVFNQNVIIPKETFSNDSCRFTHCKLPECDYSDAEFKKFVVSQCEFTQKSRIPQNFFRTGTNQAIFCSTLPEMDYSGFDFSGLSLSYTRFYPESKLPEDRKLFQRLHKKEMQACSLPKGDYSSYDFSGVDITMVKFTDDSILPCDLLSEVRYPSHIQNQWSLQFIRDVLLHQLPEDGIFDLRNAAQDSCLLTLLHAKYKNNKRVLLPDLE